MVVSDNIDLQFCGVLARRKLPGLMGNEASRTRVTGTSPSDYYGIRKNTIVNCVRVIKVVCNITSPDLR